MKIVRHVGLRIYLLNLIKNSDMDASTLNKKIELIQWLSALEDKSVIEKLFRFRTQENKEWWNTISEAEQVSVEKGIADSENGDLHSHSQARKLYEKWL